MRKEKKFLENIPINKIHYFRQKILKWFDQNQRIFSWRSNKRTCYEIIIAEILLQRTKAETVDKYYDEFLKQFGSWQDIYNAEISQVEDSLKPFGLWKQRSARLKKLSETMNSLDNDLPVDYRDLKTLPMFGQYIENAVLTQCYGKKRPFLDVSMARVLERFFGPRKLADIRFDPYLQELAQTVINKRSIEDVKKINWSILDFAASVCTKKPKCNQCPIAKKCSYLDKE